MRYSILLSCFVLLLAANSSATTYIVNPDGTGDFPTIQAAVDAVADGDVIELTDGTFTGEGNRDIDYLGKAITIRSESGDPERCIIDCQASWPDYHRSFFFHCGEGPGSLVEGISIRNGRADRGGGIYCSASSPSLADCILSHNSAHAPLGSGGGMYCLNCSPTLANCTFSHNSAVWNYSAGGGLYCQYSSPTLIGCTFISNSADDAGTAGGILCSDGSSPTLTRCTFAANSAAVAGGGIFWEHDSSPTLTDCVFFDNSAGGGGAACCQESPAATLTRCTFYQNSAEWGGGLACEESCPRLVNCTFSHNRGEIFAGGIFCFWSTAILENTIIAFSTEGEAVYVAEPEIPTFTCCDIYGNAGGDWRWPISNQWGVNGNFSLDPCFCNPDSCDYHLWNYSPCNQESCGLIGAWPVGCEDAQVVREQPLRPKAVTGLLLSCNVPNPFRCTARINYTIPNGASTMRVVLNIYGPDGRLVRALVNPSQPAGTHNVRWDGADQAGQRVGTGVYFCRLSVGEEATTRRMICVR